MDLGYPLSMNHLGYVDKYYTHLYTVTGGKLRLASAVVPFMYQTKVYQVTLEARWNGKAYAGSYRIPVKDVDLMVLSRASPWGDPNHPLVYQTALMLRELCKTLAAHGCDYAIPL